MTDRGGDSHSLTTTMMAPLRRKGDTTGRTPLWIYRMDILARSNPNIQHALSGALRRLWHCSSSPSQAHLEYGSSHPRRTELTRDQSSQSQSWRWEPEAAAPQPQREDSCRGPDQSIPYPKNKNGLDGERERTGRQHDGPPSLQYHQDQLLWHSLGQVELALQLPRLG